MQLHRSRVGVESRHDTKTPPTAAFSGSLHKHTSQRCPIRQVSSDGRRRSWSRPASCASCASCASRSGVGSWLLLDAAAGRLSAGPARIAYRLRRSHGRPAASYLLADCCRLRWSCGRFDDLMPRAPSTLCSGTPLAVCHPSRALLFAVLVPPLDCLWDGQGSVGCWRDKMGGHALHGPSPHRPRPTPSGLTFAAAAAAPHGKRTRDLTSP